MAAVLFYVYEQDYLFPGWAEDGGAGMTLYSWYDRDIAGGPRAGPGGGGVIPVYVLEAGFFQDADDTFYVKRENNKTMFTTELHPQLFIDQDVFFVPTSVRALDQPTQMLRNEVRRVR